MSIEEQDQILGRLTRESRESRRKLAALSAKVEAFRSDLTAVAKTLTGFMDKDAMGPDGSFRKAATSARGMPQRDDILTTLDEFRDELERLTGIESQLARFN